MNIQLLEEVESLLEYGLDCDHYCEEDGCYLETPKCREMR